MLSGLGRRRFVPHHQVIDPSFSARIRGLAVLRAAALLAGSVVVSGLFLGHWVWPLRGVIRGDLHGDSSLLTWNLWAMTEAVLRGRDPYFTSLLYSPAGANLATHTYGLGFLPIGLLCRGVLHADPTYPIVAYRVTIGACFALGLFAAFHALRCLGAAPLAAIAAAVAWTFSLVFRSRALESHLVSAAFLLPAITLALLRLVARPTRTRAAVLGATLGGCVYFSEYYSAFLWLGVLLLACAAAVDRQMRAEMSRVVRELGASGVAMCLASFAVIAAPFLVHWALSDALPLKTDQAYFESANLAGFLAPNPVATPLYAHATAVQHLAARVRRGVGGEVVFLGLPVLAFALLGLLAENRRVVGLAWLLAAVFLSLSLGPELKVFGTNTRLPLPYRALMEVPPFEMARAPARLAAIGLWGLVVAMAMGLTTAARYAERRAGRAAAMALGLAVIAWCVAENHGPSPPVDTFVVPSGLNDLGPGAVLNLPLSPRDSFAMLLQTLHGRPIATGYVSRLSRAQADHVAGIDALLRGDAHGLGAGLQRLGIGSVIAARGTADADLDRLHQAGLHVVDLRELP